MILFTLCPRHIVPDIVQNDDVNIDNSLFLTLDTLSIFAAVLYKGDNFFLTSCLPVKQTGSHKNCLPCEKVCTLKGKSLLPSETVFSKRKEFDPEGSNYLF